MITERLPMLVERAIGVHSEYDLAQLRKGKVAIVGVGCDGCEVAEQLVRTGVGEITLIDGDIVEETNLNRQRLYAYTNIGTPKVYAAKRRLQEISPYSKIKAHYERLSYANGEILSDHDVIVQGLDSMCARITAHEIANNLSIPIVTMSGQPPLRSFVSTVLPEGPSYQVLFGIPLEKPVEHMSEDEKKNLDSQLCKERAKHAVEQGADTSWYEKFIDGKAGWSITLGRAPVTGTLQANEVIRLLTGMEPFSIAPKLQVYDGNGLKEFGFPQDISKVLVPPNGRNWDYRMF